MEIVGDTVGVTEEVTEMEGVTEVEGVVESVGVTEAVSDGVVVTEGLGTGLLVGVTMLEGRAFTRTGAHTSATRRRRRRALTRSSGRPRATYVTRTCVGGPHNTAQQKNRNAAAVLRRVREHERKGRGETMDRQGKGSAA